MNDSIFFAPLIARFGGILLREIRAYAEHLQIPSVWLLQFLNTNLSPEAKDGQGVSVIANGLLHFSLRNNCDADLLQPEDMEQTLSDDEACLCASCAFEELRGKLGSYYDFYAALIWPEMVGKADEWEAQTDSGPYSKQAFKDYVRSTVPQKRQAQVFGEAV